MRPLRKLSGDFADRIYGTVQSFDNDYESESDSDEAKLLPTPRMGNKADNNESGHASVDVSMNSSFTPHHPGPPPLPSSPLPSRPQQISIPFNDNQGNNNNNNNNNYDEVVTHADIAAGISDEMSSIIQTHRSKILEQWSPHNKRSPRYKGEQSSISANLLILGFPLSRDRFTPAQTYIILASMVFFFTLIYGVLQELVIVEVFDRKLSFFLANVQFGGYMVLGYFFSIINIISDKKNNSSTKRRGSADLELGNFRGTTPVTPSTFSSDKRPKMRRRISNDDLKSSGSGQSDTYTESVKSRQSIFACRVPFLHWLFLGFLRSIDLGLTNASLRYVNYPVKTLLKSSRVIFTMIAGIFVMKKKHRKIDYFIVCGMVCGLVVFMRADVRESHQFSWLGVAMLTTSLSIDGIIVNFNEVIMNRHGLDQDDFIFKMYSVAFIVMAIFNIANGEMRDGLVFVMSSSGSPVLMEGADSESESGAVLEVAGEDVDVVGETSSFKKISLLVLFVTTGFLGSSVAGAITREFGALAMSITSTARKAMTLFLSFILFPKVCTIQHVIGIAIFISSLSIKAIFASSSSGRGHHRQGKSLPA